MRQTNLAGTCALSSGGWRGVPPGVNPGGSFCRNISQLPSRDANLVTTQTWGVTQRYIYSPYGSMIILNADFSTPPAGTQPISDYLYQGMTLDAVTGLYYARNRNYSPSLGIWISQDPLQYVNGADTYQVEMSEPVGAVDPSGLHISPNTPIGNIPPQLFNGAMAHIVIEGTYIAANNGVKNVWANLTLATIVKYAGGNVSGLPAGSADLRPDLVNKTSRDLYEIKSFRTGMATAFAKALVYVFSLQKACVRAKLGNPNGAGARGSAPLPNDKNKIVIWLSPTPGVILYRIVDRLKVPKWKPEPLPIPVRVPEPVRSPGEPEGPRVPSWGPGEPGPGGWPDVIPGLE